MRTPGTRAADRSPLDNKASQEGGHFAVVRLLFDSVMDVHMRDKDNWSASENPAHHFMGVSMSDKERAQIHWHNAAQPLTDALGARNATTPRIGVFGKLGSRPAS